ncbi:MAG: transcription antitermination factor NusB [bacterium]|nr:MAG: transcription antitermination factor NusB [bacterium]
MGVRRRGREAALKILYSMDLNPVSWKEATQQILDNGELPDSVREFTTELVEETVERLEEIDDHIRKASLKWEISRMAAVDRNVIRLAVSELTGKNPKPVRVVLNEAIELAKKFGGEESGTFVNGVLDRVRTDLGMEI